MKNEELYCEYMSNGYDYKKLAEKLEARDETGLAKINYTTSLKWFQKALIIINKDITYIDDKHKSKIEKYIRDAKWECKHCIDKIEKLNNNHCLNRL
jgi:hypothetical protein